MKQKITTFGVLPIMPVTLIATENDGILNVAPHGQICTVCAKPPVVALAVMKAHQTADNILKTGLFSVNIPSENLLEKVLFCGAHSGKEHDKSSLFSTFLGAQNIPFITECPINFSCKVINFTEMHDTYIFFAEVTETFADETCMGSEWPDVPKTHPLTCSLDGTFWSIGKKL